MFAGAMKGRAFDASFFQLERGADDARVWLTSKGDALALLYFAIPPDIDADLQSISSVCHFCGSLMAAAGAAIVDMDVICA
ncbi:MAG: hypothetical protein OJF50_005871 [Nitrospira sp.]|jgi:hypothetical protein|nr:hypothetical protein [Nitrospira sp.]